MSDEHDSHRIDCSLGTLDLTVEGSDEEWVRETFQEEWQDRLEEAEDISKALRDGTRGSH